MALTRGAFAHPLGPAGTAAVVEAVGGQVPVGGVCCGGEATAGRPPRSARAPRSLAP